MARGALLDVLRVGRVSSVRLRSHAEGESCLVHVRRVFSLFPLSVSIKNHHHHVVKQGSHKRQGLVFMPIAYLRREREREKKGRSCNGASSYHRGDLLGKHDAGKAKFTGTLRALLHGTVCSGDIWCWI